MSGDLEIYGKRNELEWLTQKIEGLRIDGASFIEYSLMAVFTFERSSYSLTLWCLVLCVPPVRSDESDVSGIKKGKLTAPKWYIGRDLCNCSNKVRLGYSVDEEYEISELEDIIKKVWKCPTNEDYREVIWCKEAEIVASFYHQLRLNEDFDKLRKECRLIPILEYTPNPRSDAKLVLNPPYPLLKREGKPLKCRSFDLAYVFSFSPMPNLGFQPTLGMD